MWNRRKTVIIAGCSRFGASLAGEVSEHGNNVIVVEKDGGAFRKLPANFSGFQIVGNVLDPDVLEEAGIWKASVVVQQRTMTMSIVCWPRWHAGFMMLKRCLSVSTIPIRSI